MTASFQLTFNAKRSFFDKPLVERSIDKARIKALSTAGKFVRRSARQSMRRTKTKVSDAGQPPRAHGPDPNLKTIFYVYDPRTKSVVVGPVRFNGGGGKVPALMEFGGESQIAFFLKDRKDEPTFIDPSTKLLTFRKTRKAVPKSRVQFLHSRKAPKRTVRYQPRPFMGPALQKEEPGFAALWADSLPRAA